MSETKAHNTIEKRIDVGNCPFCKTKQNRSMNQNAWMCGTFQSTDMVRGVYPIHQSKDCILIIDNHCLLYALESMVKIDGELVGLSGDWEDHGAPEIAAKARQILKDAGRLK